MDSDLGSFMYLLIVTSRLCLMPIQQHCRLLAGHRSMNTYLGQGTFWTCAPILGLRKMHFVKFYFARLKLCCDCASTFNAARTKLFEVA